MRGAPLPGGRPAAKMPTPTLAIASPVAGKVFAYAADCPWAALPWTSRALIWLAIWFHALVTVLVPFHALSNQVVTMLLAWAGSYAKNR